MTTRTTYTRALAGMTMALLANAPVVAQDAITWELSVTDADRAIAVEAGSAAGAAVEATEAPANRKIGILMLSAQSATSVRVANAAREIGELFGYEVIECDPNFDAQKVAQCATSLVAQNVDVVFSVSQNPGPMGSALNEAQDRGIPWIGTADAVTPSPALVPYGAPGELTGAVITAWLQAEMTARKGEGNVTQLLALTAPTVGVAALAQEQTVLAAAEASDTFEVAVKHDLDLANIVQDTLSTTAQTMQQYSGLAGIWTVCDFCVPLIAQAVSTAGIAPEDRPVISGNYATPQTIEGLRAGNIDGVVDVAWEASVWVGMDQVISKWARGTDVAASFDVFTEGYSLDFMQPYMVTSQNVGESGPAPIFGPDFESFFRAKWKAEYGVGE